MQQAQWKCPTCTHLFPSQLGAVIQHDGCNGKCLGCGSTVARVDCPSCTPKTETWWMPLVGSVVARNCPLCGVVMRVGKEVLESQASKQVKQIAMAAVIFAVVVGVVEFLDRKARH